MLRPAEILTRARQSGHAIAAFNAVNLETAEAIAEGAEGARAPVILQISQNAARSLAPLLDGAQPETARSELLLESHGMRHLYSQRALVTDDGWRYLFNPSHDDERHDLTRDPGELVNRIGEPASSSP